MANWVVVCRTDDIDREDVIDFSHDGRDFAVYQSPDGAFFATDGLCTHAHVHLADGLVMDDVIECPMHNGRFNYKTGKAMGAPACIDLVTYQVKVEDGEILIDMG